MRNMNVGVKVARQVRTAEHAIDQAMIEDMPLTGQQ